MGRQPLVRVPVIARDATSYATRRRFKTVVSKLWYASNFSFVRNLRRRLTFLDFQSEVSGKNRTSLRRRPFFSVNPDMSKFHFILLAQFLIGTQMYILTLNFTHWHSRKKALPSPGLWFQSRLKSFLKHFLGEGDYMKQMNKNFY